LGGTIVVEGKIANRPCIDIEKVGGWGGGRGGLRFDEAIGESFGREWAL